MTTNRIPGGLAAHKTPADFPAKSLAQGRKVELEHTSSPAVATEISMDHLTEDPQYYPKLKRMEAKEASVSLAYRLGAIAAYRQKQAGLPLDVVPPKPTKSLLTGAYGLPKQRNRGQLLQTQQPAATAPSKSTT